MAEQIRCGKCGSLLRKESRTVFAPMPDGRGARKRAGDDSGRVPAAEGPGAVIGRYRLLELLGEGGMGQVYLAEQQEPVQRRVALKIVKLGMDTMQVVSRFRAEQQTLAMLAHPNIAHVFDAGTTESGRPYFVMEYVEGVPITAYCDAKRLSLDERLELFFRCAGPSSTPIRRESFTAISSLPISSYPAVIPRRFRRSSISASPRLCGRP